MAYSASHLRIFAGCTHKVMRVIDYSACWDIAFPTTFDANGGFQRGRLFM